MNKDYVTVYQSIGGWKMLHMWWNKDQGGFWEPYQTGDVAFNTREDAVEDARQYAVDSNLELFV